MSDHKVFTFNFGPVSRTLGENQDSVAFAPLPLHETLTAFLGARTRDEFIAWLLHDSFKALFLWRQNIKHPSELQWLHVPRDGSIERLAQSVGISPQLILTHHERNDSKRAVLKEGDTIRNDFDQLYLGEKARFVQISFGCLPSASTVLLRLVVLEAFLQKLSEIVAREIEGLSLPFSRVDYVFRQETRSLNESAITAQYDLTVTDGTMTITHYIPSMNFQEQTVTIDLTATPPDRNRSQRLALPELLTIYRDDLTLIAGLPLCAKTSLGDIVSEIQAAMPDRVRGLLNMMGISPSHKWATDDLIAFTLAEQVEIRPLEDGVNESFTVTWQGRSQQSRGKVVSKLIARPQELMADKHLISRCACCGSPIVGGVGRYLKAGKASLEDVFSGRFTDFEHVGLEQDVCPMCMIYANYDNRQLMRGSLAFLSPSTSLHAPSEHTFERPRFDHAGRFDPTKSSMVKSAVTLQELVLLTMMSRRVIDQLVPFTETTNLPVMDLMMTKQMPDKTTADEVVGKHLLYSGAYLLFNIAAINQLYRNVFLRVDEAVITHPTLWQSVKLIAYPFEIKLSPSFSMLLELRVSDDFMNHAGSHTLLRLAPTTVYLSPEFSCHVLVDNSLQETLNQSYADSLRLIGQLAATPGVERHQYTAAILTGQDPITAAYEAAELPKKDKSKKGGKQKFDHKTAAAGRVFEDQVSATSLEEMWVRYQALSSTTATAAQDHSTLIHFIPKPKKKGG
jgi:hypothetical protein